MRGGKKRGIHFEEEIMQVRENTLYQGSTLESLRQSAKCALAHIIATPPDSLGKVFCYLDCLGCKDKNFCLRIKREIESELNMREEIKRFGSARDGSS